MKPHIKKQDGCWLVTNGSLIYKSTKDEDLKTACFGFGVKLHLANLLKKTTPKYALGVDK